MENIIQLKQQYEQTIPDERFNAETRLTRYVHLLILIYDNTNMNHQQILFLNNICLYLPR